ncbi:S1C family serine protease [Myxococcota bacterium]
MPSRPPPPDETNAAATGDTGKTESPAKKEASAKPPPKRSLGLKVRSITPEVAEGLGLLAPTGALIVSVKPGGAADKGQLKANDVILTVNEKPIKHARFLSSVVQETHPRQRIRVQVWRKKKSVMLFVSFPPDSKTDSP